MQHCVAAGGFEEPGYHFSLIVVFDESRDINKWAVFAKGDACESLTGMNKGWGGNSG